MLVFDRSLAAGYAGSPQQIRVMSEAWAGARLYCPACGGRPLCRLRANTRAADLLCPEPGCREQYELKSSKRFGRKIVDGAYRTMLERVQAADGPNFILLQYSDKTLCVDVVSVVPRVLFSAAAIEPRRPLSGAARRAGWIGCNILISQIPSSGLVRVVEAGEFVSEELVRRQWLASSFLHRVAEQPQRTWLLQTWRVVEQIARPEFELDELYRCEDEFRALFPQNCNIRAKLRQQMQRLRDEGRIVFLGDGRYRLVPPI